MKATLLLVFSPWQVKSYQHWLIWFLAECEWGLEHINQFWNLFSDGKLIFPSDSSNFELWELLIWKSYCLGMLNGILPLGKTCGIFLRPWGFQLHVWCIHCMCCPVMPGSSLHCYYVSVWLPFSSILSHSVSLDRAIWFWCCARNLTMSYWNLEKRTCVQYRRHFLVDNSVFHGELPFAFM